MTWPISVSSSDIILVEGQDVILFLESQDVIGVDTELEVFVVVSSFVLLSCGVGFVFLIVSVRILQKPAFSRTQQV